MTTRKESRDEIRRALNQWREDGVKDPVIPSYNDQTGDGIPDYYGLDSFGRVEVRDGANLVGTDISTMDQPAEAVGP